MRDWMFYDYNKNNVNDPAFETWVDTGKNNKMDKREHIRGDFALLKDMGCDVIRFYHVISSTEKFGYLPLSGSRCGL